MIRFILLVCLLSSLSLTAQQYSKFGKVSGSDLQIKTYSIDPSSNAVVLFDVGSSEIIGNKKEWFSISYKRHSRIHILSSNGYNNATIEIPLYTNGDYEEELNEIKATSYNLENGKVVATKLEKTSIFKEKISKNLVVKKFTFPNVKEGTIIEYEYRIISDFLFNLQPWGFQGANPVLWSEYKVSIPQFLNYILISQGNLPFFARDQVDDRAHFSIDQKVRDSYGAVINTEKINFSCGMTTFRWAMKDIPSLHMENYTTTIANYIAKLEFQLSGFQSPLAEEKVMTSWKDLAKKMLAMDDFGKQLENLNWLNDHMSSILSGASTESEKARKIFSFIRDNFTCTDSTQLYAELPLRNVFKSKTGGVSELNLLLTAMLRHAGLAADPVILSTRSNGFVYERYPVIGRFNYVIVRSNVDGMPVFLDASRKDLGFGKLLPECYNGQARIINQDATEIRLESDDISEISSMVVSISNDQNDQWAGMVRLIAGNFESGTIRQKIRTNGNDDYSKQVTQRIGNDFQVEEVTLDSLHFYEEPVSVNLKIKSRTFGEGLLYVNPVFNNSYRQNPFKSAERKYPVEMPFKINDSYQLTMAIPRGYAIDELPKSLTIKLNPENEAVFSYRIMQTGNMIQLESRLEVNKTKFDPSAYDQLREFFNLVGAKLNEQIVFKKL